MKSHKTLSNRAFCSVILASAGSSRRMEGINKLFAIVAGAPVAAYSLSALENCDRVDEVIVVCRKEDFIDMAGLIKEFGFTKPAKIITGADTRQGSVYLGIQAASEAADVIATHDCARPLVSSAEIGRVLDAAAECGGAVLAVPVKDTIKLADNGRINSQLDRGRLWAMQTPQAFSARILRAAYDEAVRDGISVTDDTEIFMRRGGEVSIMEGSGKNLKITTAEDLIMIEALIDASRGERG